jgi:hypothetical protein
MKPTPFFFACSLVINAGLIGILLMRSPSSSTMPESTVRTTEASGISGSTKKLLSEPGNENLENLRDRLLAEGLPAATVEQIIKARLWSAHEARVEAADPIPKRPWWQQTETQLAGDDVRMERIREISLGEFHAQMNRLFPERAKNTPDPATAFLSASTRDAVEKLTADYKELRTNLRAEAGAPYEFEEDRKKMDYLRNAEDEDLRGLLSANEYREFKLRDAGHESELKKKAVLLNMTEAEFRGMLAINEWRADQNQKLPSLVDDPFATLSPEQAKEQELLIREQARLELELLGRERYKLYALSDEREYETVSRYVARYELPASRIIEYFELSESAYERARVIIAQETPLEQRQQAVRALAKTVKASLESLTGSQSTQGLPLDNLIQRMEAADW